MKKLVLAASAAAYACAFGGSADATQLTRTYNFTADNFTAIFNTGPAPVPVVHGSFTVTFDSSGGGGTAGISLNSLNLQQDSPLHWSFDPGFLGLFSVGGTQGGDGVQNDTNDFSLSFFYAPDAPSDGLFFYAQTSNPVDFFETHDVCITADSPAPGFCGVPGPGTSGVPEPAAWVMMLSGFGLIGGALRRRTTAAATATA